MVMENVPVAVPREEPRMMALRHEQIEPELLKIAKAAARDLTGGDLDYSDEYDLQAVTLRELGGKVDWSHHFCCFGTRRTFSRLAGARNGA